MPEAGEEQAHQGFEESQHLKTGTAHSNRPRKSKSLRNAPVSQMSKKKLGNFRSEGRTKGSTRRNAPHKKKSSKQQFLTRCQEEDPLNTNENGEHAKGNRRRRKRKRPRNNVELDEPSRLKRRTRYLLIRMRVEQNLLDAYATEGWKGHSREKIRPERELQRATKQILKCKLGLRDAIRELDLLGSKGCIEDSAIAADGSVHHEHIHCAKCKLREAFPDNDIILCDGTCNCAFHQNCIDPPLLTENIPPGDEGWFCNICECKMDIIETINAHLGTNFSDDSNWQGIFRDEAALPEGGRTLLHSEQDWPSDDSEDNDYDPEGPEQFENSCGYSMGGSDADASDEASSSSSLCSLEDESFTECGMSKKRSGSLHAAASSDETSDCEIISGRRQRRAVDYQKLYDEMFGKDAPAAERISEDEDWGPTKRKRREKESDAASTLMTLCETEERCADENHSMVKTECPRGEANKRPLFRIPAYAVEKLRVAFAENELPSRTVKENLSKQLGLDSEKVNKWFKNARYLALKSRKGGCETLDDVVSPIKSKESGSEIGKEKTADQMQLKDMLPADVAPKPKRFRRRKNAKSLASTSTKQQDKETLLLPPENDKADEELGDDVSLKMLKKKVKSDKKKVVSDADDSPAGVEEAEAEMTRLCRMQDKIERLQEVLRGLPCCKSGLEAGRTSNEPYVMYVPVAELKEMA